MSKQQKSSGKKISNTTSSKKTGNSKKKSKQKKFSTVPLFLQIVLSIVLSFTVIAGGAGFAYYKLTGEVPLSQTDIIKIQGSEITFFDTLLKKNIKLNIALMGVDEDGTRTDTLLVAHYDSSAKSLELVSVPRDTRVTLSSEAKSKISSVGRSSPSVLKINEVHAYAGQEVGPDCTVLQLEDLLGIQIDHYVKINTASFRELIDAVGGVDLEVPQNMYKNALEPNGGGIMINLKAGYQTLDGAKAEQFVRFRDYVDGDVGRVAAQQIFLEALVSKILNTQTLLNSINDLVNIAYTHIDTNLSISDALKYVNYITDLDMNNISTQTIPGVGQYVGGVSYYLHDSAGTADLVQEVFYTSIPADDKPESVTSFAIDGQIVEPNIDDDSDIDMTNSFTAPSDSKDLTILVSNGSGVNGLAGKFTDILEEDGYTLLSPETHFGTKQAKTIIYTTSDGVGEDLLPYFKNAEIQVDSSSVGTSQDIHIILGTSE